MRKATSISLVLEVFRTELSDAALRFLNQTISRYSEEVVERACHRLVADQLRLTNVVGAIIQACRQEHETEDIAKQAELQARARREPHGIMLDDMDPPLRERLRAFLQDFGKAHVEDGEA